MVQVTLDKDSQGHLISLCSLGAALCMVVAIMGIKFKWFKRRLDFEQWSLPGETRPRVQSSEDFLAQGVFRKRNDEDGFTDAEKLKTLPPIKMHSPLPRGAHKTGSSPPRVPAIPPPDFSPIQTNFYHEESQSNNNELTSKSRTFQKRNTSGAKSPQKLVPRINEDVQERRQTGLFTQEKIDADNSYIKDYSEGLGMSHRNSSKQAPDLLTSTQDKSAPSLSTTEVQMKSETEKVSLQLGGLSDTENEEEDIFAKIRIPKPEPRSSLPHVQAKRKIGDVEHNKYGTEV